MSKSRVAPVFLDSINQSINQFISETADSTIEIHDNDNVQPLTEIRKGCCQRYHPT